MSSSRASAPTRLLQPSGRDSSVLLRIRADRQNWQMMKDRFHKEREREREREREKERERGERGVGGGGEQPDMHDKGRECLQKYFNRHPT